ncbi:LLM class flavin-dependent oxidoreductase [Thermomicrobiaceae bacterium CFH 74404]|uniref:LLM class flavin-dependent oxidoreductase n=1 Tax=Thermalbibacter longus TaxID=2951981 RepID=A0AA41WG51_9BACT|nr:LLM class flavin-dependent oxidoreductase [Thermalbibacter longus]MCM8749488.1 LLM class flavin-dependent oxidoreductase [Thermalbibacter longus]
MSGSARGFGLAATTPATVIRAAAAAAEEHGYRTFWVNDTPDGDGLAALAQAATATERIGLGVGVIPLSRRTPESIVEQVRRLGLPLDRLRLGVGSGSGPGALRRVRQGIRALREALPAELVVAALGPRMCRLAGAEADAVLFNWLTPEHARVSAGWLQEGADQAGRPRPKLYAYVRVAIGPAAIQRLEQEAGRYERIPGYSEHFARMGVSARQTAIAVERPEELPAALQPWDGVLDELVVRAITAADTEEQVLELVRAAAPSNPY